MAGQSLIISCLVITWQTVLVSQAGVPTVSAVEPVEQGSQKVELLPHPPFWLRPCQSTISGLGSHVAGDRRAPYEKSDIIAERE